MMENSSGHDQDGADQNGMDRDGGASSTPPACRRAAMRKNRSLGWGLMLLVIVSSVGCDQAVKQMAVARLKGHAPASYCGDLLRLEYAENPGAFLGLGGDMSPAARWTMLVLANGLIAGFIAVVLALDRRMALRAAWVARYCWPERWGT